MKFKTFRNIAIFVGLVAVLLMGSCTVKSCKSWSAKREAAAQQEAVLARQQAVYNQQLAEKQAAAKVQQEEWIKTTFFNAAQSYLSSNSDCGCTSEKSYTVTIEGRKVQFQRLKRDDDAMKFPGNLTGWGQARIDFDGIGGPDEKWMIKGNKFYKREFLTTSRTAEYFK